MVISCSEWSAARSIHCLWRTVQGTSWVACWGCYWQGYQSTDWKVWGKYCLLLSDCLYINGTAVVQWLRQWTCTQQTCCHLLLVPIWVVGGSRKGIRPKLLPCTGASPTYLVGASKPLNKGVSDIKSRQRTMFLIVFTLGMDGCWIFARYWILISGI